MVDGLQRISTIFAFFGLLKSVPEKNNSTLTEGEMVRELNGLTSSTLPIKLKTTIKRSVCRIEIVRWDSVEDIRYELFNRLNTGASPLSDQEIRNCIFRAYPVDLNQILRDTAKQPALLELIAPSESKKEAMYLEELTLRFFAFKHLSSDFRTTVPQYLTEFMRSVSKGDLPFDLTAESKFFLELVNFLNDNYGKNVFRPKGNFALHLFGSIAYALPKKLKRIKGNEDKIKDRIANLKKDRKYNSIGTSTFSNTRIRSRMTRAAEIFNAP